jgi:hypothetical protein
VLICHFVARWKRVHLFIFLHTVHLSILCALAGLHKVRWGSLAQHVQHAQYIVCNIFCVRISRYVLCVHVRSPRFLLSIRCTSYVLCIHTMFCGSAARATYFAYVSGATYCESTARATNGISLDNSSFELFSVLVFHKMYRYDGI